MSLRTRLFGTYALIVLICLAIAAVAITALLQGYRDRLATDRLDNMARPIAVQVRSLATDQITADRLWATLQEQAKGNEVYILLARADGRIVRQITPGTSQEPLSIRPRTLPGSITRATQGRFTTTDGRIFLYAAYPLGRLPTTLATSTETIILAVPRTGSLAILAGLLRPLAVGGIIALAISLFVAIVFARSIYRPLNKVKEAAGRIARGDYEQKIPAEGPREVQELAVSFNHMTDEVKRSHQQLRHFLADVSHELKSPLTSIQGFSQALVDGTAVDDETRLKAAAIINSESRRMRRQVDELLELSRMQSGQFKMAREPVDIGEVMNRCVDIFEIQATDKGIRLSGEGTGPLMVIGDADRLEQLFCNLLDNAVKNTPNGGRVSISAAKADAFIEARINDDGPGIPPDQLPQVFERFYQVTGLRTGVGLGLTIAREITLAHGGSIEAKSEPGRGTEFVVRIPTGP